MGAGIAAVAGIENEPSSCCTSIEEAQAALRQELAGRNERWRELEFLEKGGDPLEFKFVDASGLLSLSADPCAKHLLHSDKKENYSLTNLKQDKLESTPTEDGSEPKRARGTTGKFCFVEREVASSDPLPTSISSSIEHDGKDAAKKEFDVVKANSKSAIKGQYARRNRQRSNRFGNGCSLLLDSSKVEAEIGSSNYSSGVRESVSHDTKIKDAIKEEPNQDPRASQLNETNNIEGTLKAPEKTVVVDEPPIKVSQPPDKCDVSHTEDEGRKTEQVPVEQDDVGSSQQDNKVVAAEEQCYVRREVEEQRNVSSSLPFDEAAKDSIEVEQSTGALIVDDNENILDQSVKISLDQENTTKCSDEAIPVVNEAAKNDIDLDKQPDNAPASEPVALPVAEKADTAVKTPLISEGGENHGKESKPVPVRSLDSAVDSAMELPTDSQDLDEKVQAPDPSSVQNTSTENSKIEGSEEVKVKVEDGMPESACSLSGAGLSMTEIPMNAQDAGVLQQDNSSGEVVPEGIQARVSVENNLITEKPLHVELPQEKKELKESADHLRDVKTDLSVSSKKFHKDTNAHQAESIKSGDGVKRRSFQEPPRKKCHWDFVLEEMAWLANDFMQERLWKIAAAAQVARCIVKEKWQMQFEEAELCNRQHKIAKMIAKAVTKFWHASEVSLRKDAGIAPNISTERLSYVKKDQSANKEVYKQWTDSSEKMTDGIKALPIQAYAVRFLRDSLGNHSVAQAQAPLTPDRASESGLFEFWEEQFPEESLFYTVPENAMENYCQSVVSQWETEYEQRLNQHEATLADSDMHVTAEATEYLTGTYSAPPFTSPLVTGKRSSGFYGGSHHNVGSIPTKRMRTSALAARQRAAGVPGHLLSGSATHLARSDISSCETNSQQDEITTLVDGSIVSGRTGDAESNGIFLRNNNAVDGVDSPLKNKKKKKIRPFSGGHGLSAASDMRESEQLWHRQSEQKEHIKHKGDQLSQMGTGSPGTDGIGANSVIPHGSITSNASKLMKQITNRDRGRKYKAGKASLTQAGFGIPWSPLEDQAILGLVYELGVNWELVSDILSSNSQLKGIFRKPKDCRDRYKLLTERLGGDGGDSPDDPSSSTHPLSVTQKGGTRFLPQHLEETLKSHVDCILQLHQQLRIRKLQMESQELKQLVPEHESHAPKNAGFPVVPLTPLELCDQAVELVSHGFPLQSGHGMGLPNLMASTIGLRPNSSVMSVLQGASNLQLSSSMPPSAATRDAHRAGASMRPLTAEEQRLRYSRMGAGRGLQGNSAGMMSGLSRGVPLARSGLPGMSSIGASNISTGMNNVLPNVGMGLSGATAVSSPMNMMRRPREAMPMGQSPAAVNSPSNSLVASSTPGIAAQQQQLQMLQHTNLHSQQQSPGSTQQQAYNMMRVSKERHSESQKRMLQQQPSPTSSSSQPAFSTSQSFPASQQQHVLSPHAHMFSQSAQALMQSHTLQESGLPQQHAAPTVLQQTFSQSSGSSSGQQNNQNPQQQQLLSQGHQPTSAQLAIQSKQQHQASSTKQTQQQQGKNKSMGRGVPMPGQSNSSPGQLPAQLSGQQMTQGMTSASTVQQLAAAPQNAVQSSAIFPPLPDAAGPQYQQKNFSLSAKQMPLTQTSSISTSPPNQPTSPPSALTSAQQPSATTIATLSSPQQQQRRGNQQAQTQQRRPQPGQPASNLVTQLASQTGKNCVQARSVPSQMSAGFQLGNTMNSPLGMSPPAGGIPLSSPSNSGGTGSSPQWKPGQNFSPMAAGLYNLSRNNNEGAAQPPHLPVPMAMHTQSANGGGTVSSNSLVTQESGSRGPQLSSGHATPPKPSAGSPSVRTMPASQHIAPSQRQQLTQQHGSISNNPGSSQVRPGSSGSTPGSE